MKQNECVQDEIALLENSCEKESGSAHALRNPMVVLKQALLHAVVLCIRMLVPHPVCFPLFQDHLLLFSSSSAGKLRTFCIDVCHQVPGARHAYQKLHIPCELKLGAIVSSSSTHMTREQIVDSCCCFQKRHIFSNLVQSFSCIKRCVRFAGAINTSSHPGTRTPHGRD